MAYGIDRLPDEQHRHDRRLAGVGRDFGEPDRSLDRLDLAEEGLEFFRSDDASNAEGGRWSRERPAIG
jgi:hypothetical protein